MKNLEDWNDYNDYNITKNVNMWKPQVLTINGSLRPSGRFISRWLERVIIHNEIYCFYAEMICGDKNQNLCKSKLERRSTKYHRKTNLLKRCRVSVPRSLRVTRIRSAQNSGFWRVKCFLPNLVIFISGWFLLSNSSCVTPVTILTRS